MARLFDDGQSEYLSISSLLGLSAYPFTMACWFRSDATANQGLMSLYDLAAENLHELRLRDPADTDVIALTKFGGQAFAKTSASYTVNTRRHACGIWAGGQDRRVYLDGGNKGTNVADNVNWPTGMDEFAVGRSHFTGASTFYMSGRIAWPAVWNVALSDDEVASLAAGWSPLLIRPQSLIAFWPLGGLEGQHDRDIWGGYDLTAQNTPSWADHPAGLIYPTGPLVFPEAEAPPAGGTTNPFSMGAVNLLQGKLAG